MIRDISELKQTERLFLAVRWASVPVVLLLAWLHQPLVPEVIVGLAGGLVVVNTAAWLLNRRIREVTSQWALGVAMLAVDILAVTVAISLFVYDFSTAAYAVFALVVIEAAVRCGFPGSLAMGALFAVAMAGAMLARLALFDVRFSLSGYAFWTTFMAMLALAIGALVHQSRKRQQEIHRLSGEQARLRERHRLSRELHDSLLKTLHGLSLEAHALRGRASRDPEAVVGKARFLEQVSQSATEDIRALIFDLRDDQVEPVGAWASGVIEEWSRRTGIAAELSMDGADQLLPVRLDHDLRQALGEALLNVERHAQAGHVQVRVRFSPARLEMEVEDDGKDTAAMPASSDGARPGTGLLGIRERAEQWGGTMAFAKNGSGGRLTISIPWPPAATAE